MATADSNQTGPDTDDADIPVAQRPSLNIVKDASVPGDTADAAGEVISYTIAVQNTGNQTLTGVTVADPFISNLALVANAASADGELDVGETWNYTASHVVTQGEIDAGGLIHNVATADSNQTGPDTDDADIPVAQRPSIDIEKYVSVDGGVTWEDADSPTGPTLVNTSSYDPMFKLVVSNNGNVTLSGVTVTDTKGTVDTTDDLNYSLGTLAVGSAAWETTYTLGWKAGQHTNTATADSTQSAPDSDDANYYGTMPALVTNSALCTFGDTFNLIFTPDYKLGGGNFKLSDSNPGQFYYNVFDYGTVGETKSYSFEIPYPFVTQGAVPVHVYKSVEIDDEHGQICLTPGTEIDNFKVAELQTSDVDQDGNLEYSFDVTFDGTNFVYINMHMDFGVEKQTGWVRGGLNGEDALDNPNVAGVQPKLLEHSAFAFSAEIDGSDLVGSEDVIYNDNIFKNIKGMGGLFQADDSKVEGNQEVAIKGQHIIIRDSKGALMGDAYTDADGWYFAQFLATGKATGYNAYWDVNNNNKIDAGDLYKATTMGGAAGKWANVDFTVVDPVGYQPLVGDYRIDSHNGLQP